MVAPFCALASIIYLLGANFCANLLSRVGFLNLPPAGLEMRPVNDADASTSGQTGRKEAAKKKKEFFGDTPNPGKGLRPLHSW
jgi:hypothetical protein